MVSIRFDLCHLNVMEKGEYRKKAAELGMAIICPDTSPEGKIYLTKTAIGNLVVEAGFI